MSHPDAPRLAATNPFHQLATVSDIAYPLSSATISSSPDRIIDSIATSQATTAARLQNRLSPPEIGSLRLASRT